MAVSHQHILIHPAMQNYSIFRTGKNTLFCLYLFQMTGSRQSFPPNMHGGIKVQVWTHGLIAPSLTHRAGRCSPRLPGCLLGPRRLDTSRENGHHWRCSQQVPLGSARRHGCFTKPQLHSAAFLSRPSPRWMLAQMSCPGGLILPPRHASAQHYDS